VGERGKEGGGSDSWFRDVGLAINPSSALRGLYTFGVPLPENGLTRPALTILIQGLGKVLGAKSLRESGEETGFGDVRGLTPWKRAGLGMSTVGSVVDRSVGAPPHLRLICGGAPRAMLAVGATVFPPHSSLLKRVESRLPSSSDAGGISREERLTGTMRDVRSGPNAVCPGEALLLADGATVRIPCRSLTSLSLLSDARSSASFE